jgi:uncharacterized protein YidB (DUF937 family)
VFQAVRKSKYVHPHYYSYRFSCRSNCQVYHAQLAEVIGEQTLQYLLEKTGMRQEELLAALSKIPLIAVAAVTPIGRLPEGSATRAYI